VTQPDTFQHRYAPKVFGFIPECRSASFGNSVRLRRNPHRGSSRIDRPAADMGAEARVSVSAAHPRQAIRAIDCQAHS
jgi:hypothetical protein